MVQFKYFFIEFLSGRSFPWGKGCVEIPYCAVCTCSQLFYILAELTPLATYYDLFVSLFFNTVFDLKSALSDVSLLLLALGFHLHCICFSNPLLSVCVYLYQWSEFLVGAYIFESFFLFIFFSYVIWLINFNSCILKNIIDKFALIPVIMLTVFCLLCIFFVPFLLFYHLFLWFGSFLTC